jgi:glycosyltransferase involved in cell wall biosynthesis
VTASNAGTAGGGAGYGQSDRRSRLAVIWPGYRTYDRSFFLSLAQDKRLVTRVVWIRRFRSDEPPPPELLGAVDGLSCDAGGIRVADYDARALMTMLSQVWKAVSWSDAVLTSTQAPLHSKVAFLFAKIFRKKIFIKVEQWKRLSNMSPGMRLYKKLDALMMRHSDRTFPHGARQAAFLRSHGVTSERIATLPLLSDDLRDNTRAAIPRFLADQIQGKAVVLYFGRITPQKGLMDLLRAYTASCADVPNAVLLIAGGTDAHFPDFDSAVPYERECKAFAVERLGEKAIFLGPVPADRRQDYFALADIFVHPHTDLGRLTEGWGLVINEAASMGLPILTTDRVGSGPDLVAEGESGHIVPAGDIEALGARLRELLLDSAKRERFGAVSRQLFERYHQPGRIPQILLDAIHE